MGHAYEELASGELAVTAQLAGPEYGTRRDTPSLECLHRLDVAVLAGPGADPMVDLRPMLQPAGSGREARILRPPGCPDFPGQRLPLSVRLDGDGYPGVLAPAPVTAVRNHVGTFVATPLGQPPVQDGVQDGL